MGEKKEARGTFFSGENFGAFWNGFRGPVKGQFPILETEKKRPQRPPGEKKENFLPGSSKSILGIGPKKKGPPRYRGNWWPPEKGKIPKGGPVFRAFPGWPQEGLKGGEKKPPGPNLIIPSGALFLARAGKKNPWRGKESFGGGKFPLSNYLGPKEN